MICVVCARGGVAAMVACWIDAVAVCACVLCVRLRLRLRLRAVAGLPHTSWPVKQAGQPHPTLSDSVVLAPRRRTAVAPRGK